MENQKVEKNQVESEWKGASSLEYFSEMIKHNEFNTMEEHFYNLNAMILPFFIAFRELDHHLSPGEEWPLINNSRYA